MKLIIIPSDGAVYVDNVSYSGLDLSVCPSNVHALQWQDNTGWIEFKDSFTGVKPQNQSITSLPSWALQAKIKWDEANTPAE